MKRTSIDFSEHELLTTKTEHLTTYHLKKPGTVVQNIKFINTSGLLIVTGDYGNWVFCREFHPSTDSYASDEYWVEKLKHYSTQDPHIFSSEAAKKQIQDLKKNHELSDGEKEWLNRLEHSARLGEYSYIAEAMNCPSSFPSEMIPKGKILTSWLLIIFDAYDEICSRLKMKTGKHYIIAVDFDGTMVEHSYPKIGQDIGAWDWLKKFQEEGANLILHTVRSNKFLEEALQKIKEQKVNLYSINTNPDQLSWSNSSKIHAHIYIDDKAIGCPLKNGHVDWEIVGPMVLKKIRAYYNKKIF